MSLRGRYIIDGIRKLIGDNYRMPVPPFGDQGYWDRVYAMTDKDESVEWAKLSLLDLVEYRYRLLVRYKKQNKADILSPDTSTNSTFIETTWDETIGIPCKTNVDQPILILGCGTSRLGEDMLSHGWRGPIIQTDISARVLDMMSQRCEDQMQNGDMSFVQDDANVLSAFDNSTVDAAIDKGLLDSFCSAYEFEQVRNTMNAIHRVLKPGGTFCTLSLSRPQHILERLYPTKITTTTQQQPMQQRIPWYQVQVRETSKVYVYRFQKDLKVAKSHGYRQKYHHKMR